MWQMRTAMIAERQRALEKRTEKTQRQRRQLAAAKEKRVAAHL